MKRTRSSIRVASVATALLPLWLVSPAAAQGVIATGSGRAGATVAGVVALIGLVIGGMALSRAKRRIGNHGRNGAIVAMVLGVMGVALAVLHLATTSGGFGTGNGRAGAIVATVLGLIGVALARLALARSRPAG